MKKFTGRAGRETTHICATEKH